MSLLLLLLTLPLTLSPLVTTPPPAAAALSIPPPPPLPDSISLVTPLLRLFTAHVFLTSIRCVRIVDVQFLPVHLSLIIIIIMNSFVVVCSLYDHHVSQLKL